MRAGGGDPAGAEPIPEGAEKSDPVRRQRPEAGEVEHAARRRRDGERRPRLAMPGEELLDERELEVDRDHATAARLRRNACAEPVPPGDRLAKRDQREVAAAVQDVEREVDLVSANQDGELDRARVEWQLDACRLDRPVRSKPG